MAFYLHLAFLFTYKFMNFASMISGSKCRDSNGLSLRADLADCDIWESVPAEFRVFKATDIVRVEVYIV